MSALGFPGHTPPILVGRERKLSVFRDYLTAAPPSMAASVSDEADSTLRHEQ